MDDGGRSVVVGGSDLIGAHVAKRFLERGNEVLFVALERDDEFERRVRQALDEAAWAEYEPAVPELDGRALFASLDTDGDERHRPLFRQGLRANEYWHLDTPLLEAAPSEYGAFLDRIGLHLEHAKLSGCSRFFFLSTAYLASTSHQGDVMEALPAPPGDEALSYVEAMRRAEQKVASYCRDQHLPCTILRVPTVTGPSRSLRCRPLSAAAAALAQWLETTTSDENTLAVNFMPVDRLVDDIERIRSSTTVAPLEIHHLTSTENVALGTLRQHAAHTRRSPSHVLELSAPNVERPLLTGAVCSLDTVFRRKIPAPPGLPARSVAAHVDALLQASSRATPRDLFEYRVLSTSADERLATYVRGSGAPAVAIVNAMGVPVEACAPLSLVLSRTRRVLTWESRGLLDMQSRVDSTRAGVESEVADLVALLDANRVGSTDLVAWCNGARIALEFARAMPHRVGRLVLLSGSVGFEPACETTEYSQGLRTALSMAAKSRKTAEMMASVLGETDEATTPAEDAPGPASALLRHLVRAPFWSGEHLFRYANALNKLEPLSNWQPSSGLKVLLLTAERDPVVHETESTALARQVPGAECVTLPGTHHWSLHDDERLFALVDDFLR